MNRQSTVNWTARFKEDEIFITAWAKDGKPIPKFAVFIVTYNHVNFLAGTLKRIPPVVMELVEEVLVFDDASKDDTYLLAEGFKKVYDLSKLTIHRHDRNLGYGGNQKSGYRHAIERGHDYVILLHGDGQYAPEALPSLMRPILEGKARVVFGSRMLMVGEALRGGMPLYKYVGNKILTTFENLLLGLELSEFHSGYRIYNTDVLRKIPFAFDSDDFNFDTEIIIQLRELNEPIVEVPIPTYYGEEISYVNGLKYAWNIFWDVIDYKFFQYGLRSDPRFEMAGRQDTAYALKDHTFSSHMQITRSVPYESTVLDIGCGTGVLLPFLLERRCRVTGVDILTPEEVDKGFHAYVRLDLDAGDALPFPDGVFDVIILGDIIEHIKNPLRLLSEAKRLLKRGGLLIASTGNIALFVYRILLLAGMFPYGKRGILDETHLHLYTWRSFSKLLIEGGFSVERVRSSPIPFEFLMGRTLGKLCAFLYYPLTKIWKRLFAYQFIAICRPKCEHYVGNAASYGDLSVSQVKPGTVPPRANC